MKAEGRIRGVVPFLLLGALLLLAALVWLRPEPLHDRAVSVPGTEAVQAATRGEVVRE